MAGRSWMTSLFCGVLLLSIAGPVALAKCGNMETMTGHGAAGKVLDHRHSLHLPPAMRAHQLANMRSHLAAVRAIVGLLAAGEFEQASRVAHSRLGLTPEMKKMCQMFDDPAFRDLGLAFHRSADHLGDVLAKGDRTAALRALNQTLGYCVQCHAGYRQ